MKPVRIVFLLISACTIAAITFGQGASCSSPNALPLDSISRNFSVSPTSGNAAHCSSSEFNGSGKITIFSFTTNASGSCVLVHLSTSAPVQPAEIALYTGCSSGNTQGLQTTSSVCFADGTGYWAPSETYTLLPNTTYYLRVWTPAAGTLTMSARNYPPPNNLCNGASWISPEATDDNNACADPSSEVTPIQVCASTIENTAFYTYIVASNGVSSIQLNNVSCDNSDIGPSNGFQIGFFVGACGSLLKISCTTGSGGSLTATTGWLSAGTQVFVAIDGTAGSNCFYSISAFNATVLPITLKYFTAWKRREANRLTWLTTSEKNFSHFDIEKSTDGVNFIRIGTRAGRGSNSSETSYMFDDNEVKTIQYYRLRYIDADRQSMFSNIIKVRRDDINNSKVIFGNQITSSLSLRIIDLDVNDLLIKIIDNSGREIKTQKVKINPGENSFNLNTGSIPSGFYYLMLTGENYKRTFSFVKS